MKTSTHNLLGVAGRARAGKTESLKHLSSEYGFTVVSPSAAIREELVRVHGERDFSRDEMREMGTYLKQAYGPAFILNGMEDRLDTERIAIDGVRNLQVAEKIRKLGGTVIGFIARPEVRYARDLLATDGKIPASSLGEFLKQEQPELNSKQPHGMQILRVLRQIERANIIDTSDIDLEELKVQIDDVMLDLGIDQRTHETV